MLIYFSQSTAVANTVPNVNHYPRYNMKCIGENETLRGIVRFPLRFMLYR